tara:strand:- start:292 stop:468 length:177 start_codon:yes stop_codon:yes gene_type:complete
VLKELAPPWNPAGSVVVPPQKTTPGFATVKVNVLELPGVPAPFPDPDAPELTVLNVAI